MTDRTKFHYIRGKPRRPNKHDKLKPLIIKKTVTGVWFLLIVFVFALVMGFFQVPIWIMYSVLGVMLVFFIMRNPLIFGKDPEKMMVYLKKSKRPYFHFLYYFLSYDLSAAEKAINRIHSGKSKRIAEIMLSMERKQFGEAKELLAKMGENKTTWYALAYIAINEGDTKAFEQNKGKIKDNFLLQTLEVDQSVDEGKREKAIAMLDAMIPRLKGYKLLSAVQYRKHIQHLMLKALYNIEKSIFKMLEK